MIEKKNKFKSYKANGVSYQIPETNIWEQFSFERLSISYNNERIGSDVPRNSLLLEDSKKDIVLTIDIEGIRMEYVSWDELNEARIVFALYREGTKKPVWTEAVKVNGDNQITESWSGVIEPGNYFLLIGNACVKTEEKSYSDIMGGCFRYHFRILPHGSEMVHPKVRDISFSKEKILSVKFDRDVNGENEEFDIYAFNGSWNYVAKRGKHYSCRSRANVLTVMLKPELWWLDDHYTIVLLHNREPFARCSFQWKDGGVEHSEWEMLECSSPYYCLVKHIEKYHNWKKFGALPGFRAMKRNVMDCISLEKKECPRCCTIVSEKPVDTQWAKMVCRVMWPGVNWESVDCEGSSEYSLIVDEWDDDQARFLYNVSALLTCEGKERLWRIEKLVSNTNWKFILLGTQAELDSLWEQSPALDKAFKKQNRWVMEPYSVPELIGLFRNFIEMKNLVFSDEAQDYLIRMVEEHVKNMADWTETDVESWIDTQILPRFRKRVSELVGGYVGKEQFVTIEYSDIVMPQKTFQCDDFDVSMSELNAMVGLSKLKQSLITTSNRIRFEEKRRQYGFSVSEKGGYHMIFTGNPGTGKTTVAKLIGRIFHSLGLLSKGNVIEAERSRMIGPYIGQTEEKMTELLEEARGNVLFIDEAYSLCDNTDGDRKDFGCRVLECLLTVLTEKNPDMIIIMAGYEKEMNQMLEMNPGMKGRFPYKFNFEDYNADELYQIASNLLTRSEYVLTEEASVFLKQTIQETLDHKDAYFHNARWIEQYILDGVISAMSDRVMSMSLKIENRELFQTIEKRDVQEAYQKMKPQPVTVTAPRKRIGFVA